MSDDPIQDLIDNTFADIGTAARDGVAQSIKEIEQQIHDKHGDPENMGQIWAITSSADRDGTDPFVEDLLEAVLSGEGEDMYAGLAESFLAVSHSFVKGKVGTLIRTGAWVAPSGEVAPSDHPEKMSCIITVAYAGNHVFFVARLANGDIKATSWSEAEYMAGKAGQHQALVQALLEFDYLPTALKQNDPDEYERILDAIIASSEDPDEAA